MKNLKLITAGLLVATTGSVWADQPDWILMDNFQQHGDGQIFRDATAIGWHDTCPDGTGEYWFLDDPHDPENIGMWITSIIHGEGYGDVWSQKELPGGGILPGETGTLFFRCLWIYLSDPWAVGTADRDLEYDPVTGDQIAPGAWGDFNALIRTGLAHNLEHRDGGAYIATNPPQVLESNIWYSFWLVVENTWNMSTMPATSTGVYSLYVQGPGYGDGVSPTHIPVGTDPPKDKADIRRAPVDEAGNPQAITWLQFSTNSYRPDNPSAGGPFLMDDLYFSPGNNLTHPLVPEDSTLPAAPTGLKATIVSNSQVQLSWQDNASKETGYTVLMKSWYDGNWEEIADIPHPDASGFLVENVDTGKQQRFMVRAYNSQGGFRSSSIAWASWHNPIFADAGSGQRDWWKLDWFGQFKELGRDWIYHEELGLFYVDGEDASGFHVYSILLECWFWTAADIFPYFYKYGSYDGWYFYYAGAATDDRWFARLSDGTFVRAPHINEAVPRPVAPSNLSAVSIGDSHVDLYWDDNDNYETGYKIFMKTSVDAEWSELAVVHSKNLSYYLVSGVDTSKELWFRVQSFKTGSESEFSNVAKTEPPGMGPERWTLIDDFQRFSHGQVFSEATEIGWHAVSWDYTEAYWFIEDPFDPTRISLYVEVLSFGTGGRVFMQKALPGGGIPPGGTGTLFFRSLFSGESISWHVGTADKIPEYDSVTGFQIAPGAWGDFNALIRLGINRNIEHRDGGGYVSTHPPIVTEINKWYNFWMVVENTWDMSTTPPTSTGVYSLYMQGPGIGDGATPVLIPVGTEPVKDKADFRRAPIDDAGNPQAIIWIQFATGETMSGWNPSPFLLDDFYFVSGVNLMTPGVMY